MPDAARSGSGIAPEPLSSSIVLNPWRHTLGRSSVRSHYALNRPCQLSPHPHQGSPWYGRSGGHRQHRSPGRGTRSPTTYADTCAGELSRLPGLGWQRLYLPKWDDLRTGVLPRHKSMLRQCVLRRNLLRRRALLSDRSAHLQWHLSAPGWLLLGCRLQRRSVSEQRLCTVHANQYTHQYP